MKAGCQWLVLMILCQIDSLSADVLAFRRRDGKTYH